MLILEIRYQGKLSTKNNLTPTFMKVLFMVGVIIQENVTMSEEEFPEPITLFLAQELLCYY